MKDTTFTRVCESKEGAYDAAREGYAQAKLLISMGRKIRITVAEVEDDRSLAQNRFMWGPCLNEISAQAILDGSKWPPDAWHELFRRVFLGYEITKQKVAGKKRATVIRKLRSTTKLSVRQMSDYLDTIQAFAAQEHGVQFSVRDWFEFAGLTRPTVRSPARKKSLTGASFTGTVEPHATATASDYT